MSEEAYEKKIQKEGELWDRVTLGIYIPYCFNFEIF